MGQPDDWVRELSSILTPSPESGSPSTLRRGTAQGEGSFGGRGGGEGPFPLLPCSLGILARLGSLPRPSSLQTGVQYTGGWLWGGGEEAG